MKILLTGSTGFLGKCILRELAKNDSILSLSRTSGHYRLSLENEIPIFNQKFDLVIHAAGKAHIVPQTEIEKRLFYDVNVIGTENLLKGLEKSGIPKQFVFVSSVAVYGQEEGVNINEGHTLEASDPYGLSKVQAEKIIVKWCKQLNVVCTILRLPLLVGKNPPGNLGAMVKAIGKGYYFNIGGGKARKSMVLAQDVAAFIPIVSSFGGIYNLTDGRHPSFTELSGALSRFKNRKNCGNLPLILARAIGIVGDLLGEKAPINSLKIKKIASDLTFDDTKAREVAGWESQGVVEYLKKNNIG